MFLEILFLNHFPSGKQLSEAAVSEWLGLSETEQAPLGSGFHFFYTRRTHVNEEALETAHDHVAGDR
jgi:hypothetical protein